MAKDDDLKLTLGDLDERFTDANAAAEYLESIRWANGVVCPKCGESERQPYRLNNQRRRLWKCRACRKQFTVTVGTIFESSHIPLHKWLLAFYLLCASKKGMSAHQLHRMLGVTYKTAWFMFHRIREAMSDPGFSAKLSGIVEVDETYVGGKRKGRVGRPGKGDPQKVPVVALVERGGRVRSSHVTTVGARELKGAIRENVDRKARIMTDQFQSYKGLDKEFASHEVVNHAEGEYVRGDAHTNTAEGYFANLKRGINGSYHHVSQKHLHRYLSEFDFRWNARDTSDSTRTVTALSQVEGKRLMYRDSSGRSHRP
jgi:transposase-like protein